MSPLTRLFRSSRSRERLLPLYRRTVEIGRDPRWYRDWAVPDTIDGRFDMVAAVLALVLLRLERGDADARAETVLLTEIFIDDMEGTVRQLGIGDLMVGKHVGRMMGALGGRLAAFRAAAAGERTMEEIVRVNVFHEDPPSDESVAGVAAGLQRLADGLAATPAERVLAGEVPTP